eukprot:m51a1_g5472 hypothetical protein (519) ;mRNA; r:284814-287301
MRKRGYRCDDTAHPRSQRDAHASRSTCARGTSAAYARLCGDYGVAPDPSVLVALRARSSVLKPSRRLAEADLLPLADLFEASAEDAAKDGTVRTRAAEAPDASRDEEDARRLADATSPTPDIENQCEASPDDSTAVPLVSLRSRTPSASEPEWRDPYGAEPTLARITRLDLSGCKIGSNGAELVANMLASNRTVTQLNLSSCKIGPRGFKAAAAMLSSNATLQSVDMHSNVCYADCAAQLARVVASAKHSLRYLDVSNCRLSWRGVSALMAAVADVNKSRAVNDKLILISHGNLVKEEVLNTVTHGIGMVLAAVGFIAMIATHYGRPADRVISAVVFSTAMVMVYTSSFLYHLAFQCPAFKRVMHRLDKAAIYFLIAGTYTPFAVLTLRGTVGWVLLCSVWGVGLFGLALDLVAFDRCLNFKTGLYLAMGWMAIMVAVPALTHPNLPFTAAGIVWLALGGLLYTGGVYFFVKDEAKPINHIFWHLFVLAGSVCHWVCIFWCVMPASLPEPRVDKFFYS